MYAYIGPYKKYFGPYHLAKLILFWLPEDSPTVDKVAAKFEKWFPFLQKSRERKIYVKLHSYDTWNMDETLKHIIHPMLVQLKATKQGSGLIDDDDVPDHLKSTVCPGENEWVSDGNLHNRYEYVLDEMIWAFNPELTDEEFFEHPEESTGNLLQDVKAIKIDRKGLDAFEARKQNAYRLFGKYYQTLWD